jgi:CheY-like chemotaxis protein
MEGYATIPIVALTAKAMPGDRDKCIEAGCTDFVPKPVDPERLLSSVKRSLLA